MSELSERARRLHVLHDAPHPFEALKHGSSDEVSRALGLPKAHLRGVRSFYDALHGDSKEHCVGTACWFADGAPQPSASGLHCRGLCYAPHADRSTPIPRSCLVEAPVVLRHLLGTNDLTRADYDLPDGDTILDAVERSGLVGRGGAAFATGKKWRIARETKAAERVVVANGDEGDPGAFIDRLLLEDAPHSVLAGMLACAKAIGAGLGIVFVRGEYPRAFARLSEAVIEARDAGLLPDFEVRVVRGAGSYVAGEETALLRAIEGQRAEPTPKPPYPAERGVWGLPTVVQNIETLSLIPWVVRSAKRPVTKAICVSGAVKHAGVFEAAFGTPLSSVLAAAGGPNGSSPWKMALVGGPMGRVVGAGEFDVALGYDTLKGMGHAGVVVLDERVSARALFLHLAQFAASESCGNCTPCRVGSQALTALHTRASLERLLDTLEIGSLCGFGQGLPRPIRDLLRLFPEELYP